jgi:hypothetical protein
MARHTVTKSFKNPKIYCIYSSLPKNAKNRFGFLGPLGVKESSIITSILGAPRFKNISFTSTILVLFLTKEELDLLLYFGTIANSGLQEICGCMLLILYKISYEIYTRSRSRYSGFKIGGISSDTRLKNTSSTWNLDVGVFTSSLGTCGC